MIQLTLDDYHGTSGYMFEGEVLPGTTEVNRTPQLQPNAVATYPEPAEVHPIIWRAHFTMYIIAQLVSWGKLHVQVTNSDLELAGSVLHHVCMTNCFDIRYRTMLSCTDNPAGL